MSSEAASKGKGVQLTIRNVPPRVAQSLRRQAREKNTSVNRLLVDALAQQAGGDPEEQRFHDLDWIAGTWQADSAFDRAIAVLDQVDEELWK